MLVIRASSCLNARHVGFARRDVMLGVEAHLEDYLRSTKPFGPRLRQERSGVPTAWPGGRSPVAMGGAWAL